MLMDTSLSIRVSISNIVWKREDKWSQPFLHFCHNLESNLKKDSFKIVVMKQTYILQSIN